MKALDDLKVILALDRHSRELMFPTVWQNLISAFQSQADGLDDEEQDDEEQDDEEQDHDSARLKLPHPDQLFPTFLHAHLDQNTFEALLAYLGEREAAPTPDLTYATLQQKRNRLHDIAQLAGFGRSSSHLVTLYLGPDAAESGRILLFCRRRLILLAQGDKDFDTLIYRTYHDNPQYKLRLDASLAPDAAARFQERWHLFYRRACARRRARLQALGPIVLPEAVRTRWVDKFDGTFAGMPSGLVFRFDNLGEKAEDDTVAGAGNNSRPVGNNGDSGN